jgi:hypothetical protein
MDDTERQLAAERVNDHSAWYRQDRNPLRAWLVHLECSEHRLPLPSWARAYFKRVAVELDAWSRNGAPKNLAPAMLKALEMNLDKGTVFARLKASERDFVLASNLDVERRLKRHPKQRAKARHVAAAAAGYGVKASRQTVDRAFKKFRDAGFDRGRRA